jgi:hypothetical protein
MTTRYLYPALFVLFCVVAFLVGWQRPASGLANPNDGGNNAVVTASAVVTKVNAVGRNCSVTITNMSTTPVFTGYAGVTLTTGIPVCRNLAMCVGSAFVRDTVPDAIWYVSAGAVPGVLVEVSGGCEAQ